MFETNFCNSVNLLIKKVSDPKGLSRFVEE